MGRLNGRTAIVTGAGGGIGCAIARRLAEEGASVVLTDINVAAADAAAGGLAKSGLKAIGFRHDVTDQADWDRVLQATREAFGVVDILINNAGLAHLASIEDVTMEDWRRILSVNLDGVLLERRPVSRRCGRRAQDRQRLLDPRTRWQSGNRRL